LRRCHRKQCV